MDRFRALLLRVFVYGNVSYSLIESVDFRNLLVYINPTIERYLVKNHKTISNWVKYAY